MKLNPNPKCASCVWHHSVLIDGFSGPVGHHDICVLPDYSFKEIEGYTPLAQYDEYFIDGFMDMHGECKYYKYDIRISDELFDFQHHDSSN